MHQSDSSTSPSEPRAKPVLICAARIGIALPIIGLIGSWLSFGNWMLELTVYFFPIYAWWSFACAAACFWGGARKSAGLCAVIGAIIVAHFVPLHSPAHATSMHEANLRLLDANVYEKNWRREAFPKFARKADADIVLMQEVDDDWHDRMLALGDVYPFAMHNARWPGDKMDLGQYGKVAPIATRYADELDLPATVTTHRVNGVDVKVMNLHTRSPYTRRRAAQHRMEFETLISWIQNTPGAIVLAGDLNSVPWSPLFRKLLRETRLRPARDGFGITGTWPSFGGFLRMPLDHILVSPEVEVVDFKVGPPVGSDHRPLLVALYIGEPDAKKNKE